MKEFDIKDNERLDDLECNGLKIIQNKDLYCFSSDAIILANHVSATSNDVVVDFGTGTGVIALLLTQKTRAKRIIGVEIQSKIAEIAKRNVELNSLEDRLEIINDDIKNIPKILGKESVKVVVCNPPYFKKGTGDTSKIEEKAISRTESTCTLDEIIFAASQILKYSGKMYMIHKSERLAEVITSLSKNKLEPKKLTLIYPKKSKQVDTFIIEAQKCGAPGLKIDSLVVCDENGEMTDSVKKLYNKV